MSKITKYLKKVMEEDIISLDDVILEESKDNKKIFKVKYNNKYKYIGSKYNNNKDINKFLNNIKDVCIDSCIIIFGIGTGEHILKLQKQINKFNKVLIIEPDLRILKRFLKLDSSKSIIEDERITIIAYEENMIYNYIVSFIGYQVDYNNVKFSSYANYEHIYLDKYIEVLKSLKDALNFFETNVATEIVMANNIMNTYLKNIQYIADSYMLNDFKNKFKGFTAIIVSAGPSLEKNIDNLKGIHDNAIIICGNRTLKPLLDKGITPNFMCSIFSKDMVYEMAQGYIEKEIPLIFTETTSNKLVESQKGPRIFFKYNVVDTNIEGILEKEIDTLAHNSIDFATYLGCKTIIFIGQDLSYTNNKRHATIAQNKKNNNIDNDKDMIKVKGINGELIYTTRVLDGYRKNIEDYIKSVDDKNIKFINATEGGVDIEGAESMTLEEAIHKYAIKEGIYKITRNLFISKNNINLDIVKKNVESNYKAIIELEKELKNIKKLIEKFLSNNSLKRIKQINEKISKINYKIDNNNEIRFMNFLLLSVMDRSSIYFRYEKTNDELQNAKKLLKAFDNLYNDIIQCIDNIKPKIEICINNLEVK